MDASTYTEREWYWDGEPTTRDYEMARMRLAAAIYCHDELRALSGLSLFRMRLRETKRLKEFKARRKELMESEGIPMGQAMTRVRREMTSTSALPEFVAKIVTMRCSSLSVAGSAASAQVVIRSGLFLQPTRLPTQSAKPCPTDSLFSRSPNGSDFTSDTTVPYWGTWREQRGKPYPKSTARLSTEKTSFPA